jgi:hypothetical protein
MFRELLEEPGQQKPGKLYFELKNLTQYIVRVYSQWVSGETRMPPAFGKKCIGKRSRTCCLLGRKAAGKRRRILCQSLVPMKCFSEYS